MYFFGHCTRSTKQVFPRGFRKFSPQKKKKGLTFHYRVSISSGKINFGSRNFPPFEEGEFFSLLLLRITDQATEEEKNEFPTRPNNFSRPSRWSPGTTRLSTRREDGGQLSINLYFPSPLVFRYSTTRTLGCLH